MAAALQQQIFTTDVDPHLMSALPRMGLRPGLGAARCLVLALAGEHDG